MSLEPTPDETPVYLDPDAPVDRRIDDVLSRMTLEEKLAQITAVRAEALATDGRFDESKAEELVAEGVGHISRIGGGAKLDPVDAARFANDAQRFLAEETALGIPAIAHEECLLGYMGPMGTTYPQAIGLASTWEPSLAERMTEQIRDQLSAIGCQQALSPVVDLGRDPRFGRTEETYGEDPYLVSAMGAGFVRGLQGDDRSNGVSATIKHFVGHGAPEGGRGRASLNVGERELRETHLYPFEVLVRETGVESVMNAYHDIDGVPCTASSELLTDVLREEWGFDGVVVSDYHSIRRLEETHSVVQSPREAAIAALEAGIDVELPERKCVTDDFATAVETGDIAESTIDRAVRRLLRQKFTKGLFEDPYVDPTTADDHFETRSHRDLAREVARKSTVLLENDGLLPLPDDPGSVAVLGPKADDERGLFGDYAFTAFHDDEPIPFPVVTPLDGIRAAVGDAEVIYEQGCPAVGDAGDGFDAAVEAAANADVACLFVGGHSKIVTEETVENEIGTGRSRNPTSGEGNARADLTLPGRQRALVEAIRETGTPLVAVLVTGRPLAVESLSESADALVHAWLPGEEGGHGIADVLFGRHDPSGRLPVSLPRSVGQVPVHYSRKHKSRREDYIDESADPLYTFGHGLSYTAFEYEDLSITPEEQGPSGRFTVDVTVRNVGGREGTEVVQLYTHHEIASRARPEQELRGFERVSLAPGEEKRVSFDLSAYQLGLYDANYEYVVEPGTVEFRVGHAADDVRAAGTAEITGETKQVPAERPYFTRTRVE